MPGSGGLSFAALQRRFLAALRRRLSNGEFTERGLARMIGVSQPHVHNVLKGERILTPEIGDLMLGYLDASLLELLEVSELSQALESREDIGAVLRPLPLLAGRLGPEDTFPDPRQVAEWVKAPAHELSNARRPALVELSEDLELMGLFAGATHALLDLDEAARLSLQPAAWYALRWRGAGFLRQLRREGEAILVQGQMSLGEVPEFSAAGPSRIELGEATPLQTVRARVLWVGQDPRGARVLDQLGVRLDDDATRS